MMVWLGAAKIYLMYRHEGIIEMHLKEKRKVKVDVARGGDQRHYMAGMKKQELNKIKTIIADPSCWFLGLLN